MGSFIAVLIAAAVCVVGYKIIKRNMAKRDVPGSGAGAGGSGGMSDGPPPAKS